MAISIQIQFETLKNICELYDVIKDEFDITKECIENHKPIKANFDLLDEVFKKFKKKLVDDKSKNKFTLKNYQAYYLSEFIFKHCVCFHGIFEQTLTRTLAKKIDEKLMQAS